MLETLADQLLHRARFYSWHELEANPTLPPPSPGVYAWFFDPIPDDVPAAGCVTREGANLLYVGISPGRTPSTQTLRSRVRYHYRGNPEGSTLRLTLGVLLEPQLGTQLRRVGSGNRRTFGPAEARLTQWMAEHARVCWTITETPEELEKYVIGSVQLPLNLDGNTEGSFHRSLSDLRRKARVRAAGLPVLK
jgi:hypothetical protein